jgi:hypothetical protein
LISVIASGRFYGSEADGLAGASVACRSRRAGHVPRRGRDATEELPRPACRRRPTCIVSNGTLTERLRAMKQTRWKLPITRACVLVLQEAGCPLHYREITELLLKEDLVSSRSAAVERCVYSGMSKHIRTTRDGGWFAHAGPGRYTLTAAGRALEVWRSNQEWAADVAAPKTPRLDMTWPEAITKVLRDSGKPMKANDIIARAWQNGYRPKMDGASTTRGVGNTLARLARESSPRSRNAIERVAAGTYALKRG